MTTTAPTGKETALWDEHVRELPFGPRGCPDARLWMHEAWRNGGLLYRVHQELRRTGAPVRGSGDRTPIAVRAEFERFSIKNAELYFVGADVCALVSQAAPAVPTDVSLRQELLPTVNGMAFFDTLLTGTDSRYEAPVPFNVVHWYPSRNLDVGDALEIDFYCASALPNAPFAPVGGSRWILGQPLEECESTTEKAHESALEDRRLVMALLGIIKSPGVTDERAEQPDRHSRRRSARKGITDLGAVRVINLRGHDDQGGDHAAGAQSQYHHRWIVDGHWRSQPYGPGSKFRKPVWIAPHVKGPAGAPLLHGEKVRVVGQVRKAS